MEDVFYDPLPLDGDTSSSTVDGDTSSSTVPASSSSSSSDQYQHSNSSSEEQQYQRYKYKYRPRTSTLLPLPTLVGGATVVIAPPTLVVPRSHDLTLTWSWSTSNPGVATVATPTPPTQYHPTYCWRLEMFQRHAWRQLPHHQCHYYLDEKRDALCANVTQLHPSQAYTFRVALVVGEAEPVAVSLPSSPVCTAVDDKVSSLLNTKVGTPNNRSSLAPITSGRLRRPRSSHSLLLEEVEEEKEKEETTANPPPPTNMDTHPQTKTSTRATEHHRTTGRHYWWYRFLSSLEMPDKTEEERLERWYELQLVSSDFESAATTLAKTIVTEYFLSNDQERTILPDDKLGGYAGGRKYVIRGILFKVALASTSGGLYCNANGAPDDELASKAASNEYRSTMHFARCQRNIPAQHRILVPLMVLVDYCGFRVLCSSLVPLKQGSGGGSGGNNNGNNSGHVYGSRDAGRTVFDGKNDAVFHNRIKNIAMSLNLANHLVKNGRRRKRKRDRNREGQGRKKAEEESNNKYANLCMPVDAEAHQGDDGRYVRETLATNVAVVVCTSGHWRALGLYWFAVV